jgi:hypothetical protein
MELPIHFIRQHTQNINVADEIYPEETKKYIKEFLDINTRNQKKISITSDLDDKYKPIIKKLGLKHQWCPSTRTKKHKQNYKRIYKRKQH